MCCLKQCYYCFTKAFPHPEIFIQYNLKPTELHPSIMALSIIIIVYDYSFDNKNLNLMMIQKTTYPNIDILLGRRLKEVKTKTVSQLLSSLIWYHLDSFFCGQIYGWGDFMGFCIIIVIMIIIIIMIILPTYPLIFHVAFISN